MRRGKLGAGGPELPRLGYGAMGLSGFYGAADDSLAAETLNLAAELDMMIDTADAYGNGGQGKYIFAIPGTRKPARLRENTAAMDIALDAATAEKISKMFPVGAARGETLINH